MASTRRLAAILAADVAGYSRLMREDEEGTHARLRAHFGQLVEPKIAEHRGRTVKNTGDGLLAEFPSVVDAVRCAVEVQRGMVDRNAETPENERITFRVGVNLGDVIAENDDIYGDGVNIAARLEGLAEPGGVCISRVVYEQIRDKLAYPFQDLGERSVKNIARPVRAYMLPPEAVAALPAPNIMAAPPISQPATAPRMSIVVLPFANLGNDPEQQYFADGITEDLTTDLSLIENVFVISRNTAFAYRDKPIDARQIGHELGVRYILEGSVRRFSGQVRVSAQLIDAATNAHLWAERFDIDGSNLLALQNEITSQLANALSIELIAAEAARSTEHPDALDYILRGRAALAKPPSRDTHAQVIGLFENALALDPQSVEAQSRLAFVLVVRVLNGVTDSPAADLARAEWLVDQALTTSPRYGFAHQVKGHVLLARKGCEGAISEYEAALALNHHLVGALHGLAWCKLYAGLIGEVTPLLEQAIRLSPRDPGICLCYDLIGTAHLLQSHIDEAIIWFEKARVASPSVPSFHLHLASAYALRGEAERASAEYAEVRRLRHPLDAFTSIAKIKARAPRSMSPKTRALYESTYFAGLRKAGLPEE
jgi:TolB-like protein/class 3 adenylate cyclase